jgi:hypothetical protein
MSDLSNRIVARELMKHEENVRVNAEHRIAVALAPEKWEEFKQAFRSECDSVTAQSPFTRLEHDEPDEYSFWVNRVRSAPSSVLRFTLDPQIPCIWWSDLLNHKPQKMIQLALDGSSLTLALEGKALDLSCFVAKCLDAVTR